MKTKEEEEEERCVRLEKRLVPNLTSTATPSKCWIPFGYQILLDLGWVRFFMELV
jgi:hypothetical protein